MAEKGRQNIHVLAQYTVANSDIWPEKREKQFVDHMSTLAHGSTIIMLIIYRLERVKWKLAVWC
jgi:hypothetical protein